MEDPREGVGEEFADIPTVHRDFASKPDNQTELNKLSASFDIEYNDLDDAIENMTTTYNRYVEKCLSVFKNYNKDGFIVPDNMTTKTRIKRLGILLKTVYPLLRNEIPDLTMTECSVAILFYYFSILHTNELGWDSHDVIKSFNSLLITKSYKALEKDAVTSGNQTKIDSVFAAKKMQQNVDQCLILLSFLASNENYSTFLNKTRGGKNKKKNRKSKKKHRKPKKNKQKSKKRK